MLEKIMGLFKTKLTTLPESMKSGYFGGSLEMPFDTYTEGNRALDDYATSLYLHVAVGMIASDFASIDMYLNRIINKEGDIEEVFESEYLDLIEQPNPFNTQREFRQISAMYYLLLGETYWLKEYEGTKIKHLWNLKPTRMSKKYADDGITLLGYNYNTNNGKIIFYPIEDIVYTRNPDANDPSIGLSAYKSAFLRITAEKEAVRSQAKSFKDNGKPDILVFTKSMIGKENAQEALALWNRAYNEKQNKVAILGGDIDKVEQTNLTPKELDYQNSIRSIAEDILVAFRIPKDMLFSENSNRATSDTALRNYQRNAILPLVKVYDDAFNLGVLPQESDLMYSHEDFIRDDREMLLQETVQLKNASIINQNEARALYGYETVEGGDEFNSANMNLQMQALKAKAKKLIKRKKMLYKRLSIEDKYVKLVEKASDIFPDEPSKNKFLNAINKAEEHYQGKVYKTLKAYLDDQRERILLTNQQLFDILTFMDISTENMLAKQVFKPLMASIYEANGNAILASVTGETFLLLPELLQVIHQRSDFFIESMNSTTYKELSEIIANAVNEGKTTKKVASEIVSKFEDIKLHRANTIARTETNFVLNKAHYDAYSESSVVQEVKWITAKDDRVRDEHRINDGVAVAKFGTFPSGEKFPGEHSINCRCRLIAKI